MTTPSRGERYKIKKVLTQLSFIREISKEKENVVDTIIKHLENEDMDKVRNLIENNCQEDDVKEELVRKIVNSRNIKAVTHLLKILTKLMKPVDSVDGGKEEQNKNYNKPRMKHGLQVLTSAITHATLNDDPETLEAILEVGGSLVITGFSNPPPGLCDMNEKKQLMNPMIIACVEEFYRCVKVLYRHGLRVELCTDDQKQIGYLITMDHVVANDFHLYYSLYLGSKHVNMEAEFGAKTMKRHSSFKKHPITPYLDPVDRFLRFRAFASPIYISLTFDETKLTGDFLSDERVLTASDPIRKSFACATYSKYLSTTNTQQCDEFKKVGTACIAFTEDLLDQCEDMREVRMILNYSNSYEDEQCENTNWNVALWEGHKEFVSHHYYQQFIWEKMTGDNFDWCNYFFFWKILLIPTYLMLFLVYPFVIFIDFFREGDILFVPPAVKEAQLKKKPSALAPVTVGLSLGSMSIGLDHLISPELFGEERLYGENRVFAFFREKIHRPFFRIFVRIAIEGLFILSLIYSLVDPKDKKFTSETHFYDYTTYGMFMTFLFEDVVEICRIKWKFFSSFWNAYSLFTHVLFAVGGLTQAIGFGVMKSDSRNNWSGNHPANIGATLFAIASTMAVVQSTRWFLLLRRVGPVIICVIRVLKDVAIIFILFIILYIGFSLAIYAMYKPFHGDLLRYPEQTMDSASSTFSALFWRFFDPGEPAAVAIMRNYTENEIQVMKNEVEADHPGANATELLNEKIAKGTQSLEFSHFVGVSFWAVYQGIVAIILINVLIALMNTTYTKISADSDIEWKYSKSFMYAQFLPTRAALPPPFRWFYYLACLARWVKKKTKKHTIQSRNTLEKQKYFRLLKKLIKTKMQLDIEDSIEDDFDDLRKDLKNVVNNDVKKEFDFLKKKNEEMARNLQNVTNDLESCRAINGLILNKLEQVLALIAEKHQETNA